MTADRRRSDLPSPAPVPGRGLLALAARVFEHPAHLEAARAAIADLQHEVEEAGTSRWRRARARIRGYVAFWHVVAVAPLTLPVPGGPGPMSLLATGGTRQNAFSYAVVGMWVALWLALWPAFGALSLVPLGAGFSVAVARRWWYDRHPDLDAIDGALALPARPEINVSRIRVGGDVGGVLFVVGSVISGVIGLAPIRWFALAALVCGLAIAWPLFRWRLAHPTTLTSIRAR